jgi:hypothetical protein
MPFKLVASNAVACARNPAQPNIDAKTITAGILTPAF